MQLQIITIETLKDDKLSFPDLLGRSFDFFLIKYRTRAIITRGLYILEPIFEGHKCLFSGFFLRICLRWPRTVRITT